MVFITGTDTGVGKTMITAGLAAGFRKRGYKALAIKPYQTGLISGYDDADIYDFDGPQKEARERINPVALDPPGAPWAASRVSGKPIDPELVLTSIMDLSKENDVLFIEGIGGLYVPITGDLLVIDMIKQLGCPIIIAARGRLGTINHSLLTIHAAEAAGIPILGIIFNGLTRGVDPVTDLNPEIVQNFCSLPVLGEIPVLLTIDLRRGSTKGLLESIQKTIQFDILEHLIFQPADVAAGRLPGVS